MYLGSSVGTNTINMDQCKHGNTYYYPASSCPVCHPQSPSELMARVAMLEARLTWLEQRMAGGITLTLGSETISTSGKPTCPQCGSIDYSETGNILTSMPPQTEVKCKNCHRTWGIVSWGLR
jgi:hypothetical protein